MLLAWVRIAESLVIAAIIRARPISSTASSSERRT